MEWGPPRIDRGFIVDGASIARRGAVGLIAVLIFVAVLPGTAAAFAMPRWALVSGCLSLSLVVAVPFALFGEARDRWNALTPFVQLSIILLMVLEARGDLVLSFLFAAVMILAAAYVVNGWMLLALFCSAAVGALFRWRAGIGSLQQEGVYVTLSMLAFIFLTNTRAFTGKLEDEAAGIARELGALRASEALVGLAREIHDHVGATLSAAAMQAEVSLLELSHGRAAGAGAAFARAEARMRESMSLVARLAGAAPRSAVWEDAERELRALAGDLLGPTGAELRWSAQVEGGLQLSPEALAELRRVVSEGVSNAARHAHARTVEVRVEQRGRALHVCIDDDGVGLAGAQPGAGKPWAGALASDRPGGGTRFSLEVSLT